MITIRSIILVVVLLLITCYFAYAMSPEEVEFLWEKKVPNLIHSIASPFPTVVNGLLYIEDIELSLRRHHEEGIIGDFNLIYVYDIKNGKLVDTIKIKKNTINGINLTGYGKYMVYGNDMTNVLKVFIGIEEQWEYQFNSYLTSTSIDENYIYASAGNLYIFNHEGQVINKMGIAGQIYVSDKYIYVNGNYLYKIRKDTWDIVYKKKYERRLQSMKHNEKYIVSLFLPIIDKEDGSLVNKKIKSFNSFNELYTINENYIVYGYSDCDTDSYKIICLDKNLNVVLEKELNHTIYTGNPVISKDKFYYVSDNLKVMDIKTGEIIWQDNEYVNPQVWSNILMYNDEYLFVFYEGSYLADLRVYKINN